MDKLKSLRGVMTTGYASKEWGKSYNTLKDGLRVRYGKYGKLVEGEDFIKCGKEYLITEEAMIKLFGEMKE